MLVLYAWLLGAVINKDPSALVIKSEAMQLSQSIAVESILVDC